VDQDKQQEIFDACPLLFKDRQNSRYAIQFGLECGNGWFTTIKIACELLEEQIAKMPEDEQHKYHADQIKEKFGGLRIYLSSQTDKMSMIIRGAEDICNHTCEICGNRSSAETRNIEGWYRTLCDDCERKLVNSRNMDRALE
jgi:hypothetical protein